MKRFNIKAFDNGDAYRQILNRIWYEGDLFKVGYGSEETETKKLHVSIEIAHPENRPLIDDKAPCDMKYIQEYALTYLWCPDPMEASYTYGKRMHEPVDQVAEVIRRFKEQSMDRQCTIIIRIPQDILKNSCKEPPCLTVLDYEILDGKLNCETYFRSWDAYAGLPANIAGLQLFNEAIAKEIGVETGVFILHSKNVHIYKRQYKLVQELVEIKTNKPVDVAAMVRNMKGPHVKEIIIDESKNSNI